MGVRLPSAGNNTIVNPTVVTINETVVATSQALIISLDNAQVLILWFVNLTFTAGITFGAYRIRRGTTVAGALVTVNQSVTETPSTQQMRTGIYVDTPGAVGPQQYSLTFQATAAAANTSIIDAAIMAISL